MVPPIKNKFKAIATGIITIRKHVLFRLLQSVTIDGFLVISGRKMYQNESFLGVF